MNSYVDIINICFFANVTIARNISVKSLRELQNFSHVYDHELLAVCITCRRVIHSH